MSIVWPRLRRLSGTRAQVASNVASRLAALAALGIATILVARAGTPSDVGVYALLRVLPGVVAVVAAAGLPGATPFFLAGDTRDHPRLWATTTLVMLAGGLLGAVLWAGGSPVLQRLFFDTVPVWLVALAGVTVFTQLLMTVGKTCLQGVEDIRGSNWVIATEEIAFLPPYLIGWALGMHGALLILVSLAVADLAVAAQAWGRLARRGLIHGSWRPSLPLAVSICKYGMRGQFGGLMTLLNLRFDFAFLSFMAGPAVVGIYAIASKYAELLRLPGLAVTWVVYPRVAGREGAGTAAALHRLLPRAFLANVACAVPLGAAAYFVLPLLYGPAYKHSVLPAVIIIAGLVVEAAAGLATAYLYGTGRPGLNSLAMGVGLLATLALDLALIPPFHAVGAAIASAVTYLLTDLVLVLMMLRHRARQQKMGTVPSRAGDPEPERSLPEVSAS
ncbi:MAG TPA: polysaccharide biosynthesis C-terminal domain-containing protein [Nocardioidaceae bacterium]|jgi:O-antigen/teichoic acid export membrane protein|nr:polysaccharide biosynthesis C-terminal domain-containing protein [Nocardioidaceae bacterium]